MNAVCGCTFKPIYDKLGRMRNRKKLIAHIEKDKCMWCSNSYLG